MSVTNTKQRAIVVVSVYLASILSVWSAVEMTFHTSGISKIK